MKVQSIIKTAFTISIIGYVTYWEQFISGLGILSCSLIAIIGFSFPDHIVDMLDNYNKYMSITCVFLFLSTIIHLSIGIRVQPDGNKVEVVSSFYPYGRVLGTGAKIDTLRNLARCYEYDKYYEVRTEDMYILENDSSKMLFSKHELILKGTDLQFTKNEMGHGKLHICTYRDMTGVQNEVDLYGQALNDSNYSPRIIDTSIDYNSAIY